MKHKLEWYLNNNLVKEGAEENIRLLAMNLCDLVNQKERFQKFTTEPGIQVTDKGVKGIFLKNHVYIDARLLNVKLPEQQAFLVAVHYFIKHNGHCLALALPDNKMIYSNAIQLVLEKYVSVEKDTFWIYHDGAIGGKKPLPRKQVLDYVAGNGFKMHKAGNKYEVSLGNLPLSNSMSWDMPMVQSFFGTICHYSFLRTMLKSESQNG